MSAPAIELEGVSVTLGSQTVLDSVDLVVANGDYLAILGPNGGGKTTLLKVILGLIKPSHGRVRVLGMSPAAARGRIGYVPQHAGFDMSFPIRVLDVVLMGRLGRRGLRRHSDDDRAAARTALERVELADLEARPIGQLSGGQLQRVLVARALALEPSLLLLDEPTASLDERIGKSVWELLGELGKQMTVVLVSHDIGAISRYVQSVACLNRKLHYHPQRRLTPEVIEAVYGCPIELLAHGQPHRVLHEHGSLPE